MARYITRISACIGLLARRRGERGQILMLSALMLPMLLGMTAMAVDLGSFATERRDMQNAADAIAMAAAQELPDEGETVAVAHSWAAKNGIDVAKLNVTVTQAGGSQPNPSVRVVIADEHEFAFAGVLGIPAANVGAAATAIKTSPGGSDNLVPWAVLESTREDAEPGESVTLKYDSNDVTNGNFGGIRLDGNGSNIYEDTIQKGSKSKVCAKGVAGCVDTSPICDGYTCESQTGNLVGGTRDGVDYRMDGTSSNCDDFEEVFSGPVDGQYQILNACNPWLDGSYANLRLVLVPIVESLCNGNCEMDVVEFAMFWLEGYDDDDKCSGNSCEVTGRFIDAELTTGALVGVYDPESSLHYVRLSE